MTAPIGYCIMYMSVGYVVYRRYKEMKLETISRILGGMKKGVFFRIVYCTEVPIKKSFKDRGYKVVKTSSVITRTGVHYPHISGVEIKADGGDKKRANNYEALIPDKLYFNSNTKKNYISIFPVKGNKAESVYDFFLGGVKIASRKPEEIDFSDDMFLKKSSHGPVPMQRINVENIVSINGEV